MLYNAFELQKMGEYSDNHGGTFCEPILDPILEDDEEALRVFWVIQGHMPEGGVETLIESDDEVGILAQFDFFCTLLECYKYIKERG